MPYALGQPVPLSVQVRDATSTLVDAAIVAIVITLPDGTTSTVTLAGGGITRSATGTYICYYATTQPGWHQWTGASTGPATAYGPDSFTVAATGPAPIVGLPEVRAHLGISTTTGDAMLLSLAGIASQLCEETTNRRWRRASLTETYDGGGHALALRHGPALSVTTVTESGATLTAADWTLDDTGDILLRGSTVAPARWARGNRNVSVAYVVGPAGGVIPEPIRQGNLELVRHLRETQRGGANLPRQAGAEDVWDPRQGYTIPRRVLELWDPYVRPAMS